MSAREQRWAGVIRVQGIRVVVVVVVVVGCIELLSETMTHSERVTAKNTVTYKPFHSSS
jgi:hypothetical protein